MRRSPRSKNRTATKLTVAHLAFTYGHKDVGGASIASSRLHDALLQRGVDSHYLCWEAKSDGRNVHVLPQAGLRRKLYYLLTRLTHYLLFKVPLNFFKVPGLEAELKAIAPDVVHVQWMNEDFPAFEQIAVLPYPVVYSLHDLFPVNAIAAYPCADRRFVEGFLLGNSTILERWLFARKKRMLVARPGLFVGPSAWVCREAASSLLGGDCPRAEGDCPPRKIPNIIDPAFFAVGTRKRAKNERFTILFGAHGGRANPLKGFDDLAAALEFLPREVKDEAELVIFGESGAPCETGGVRTRFVGTVPGPEAMAELYHAADVCVVPSRQDNAPQTKFEAWACGTPVIAFDRTGCGEGIVHGENGQLVPDGDCPRFAEGIAAVYRLWKTGELSAKRAKIAEKAAIDFAADGIVAQFVELYRDAQRRLS